MAKRYPLYENSANQPVVTTLTAGATIALDLSLGSRFKVTVTSNCTFSNPTNVKEGQAFQLAITQDSTGFFAVTFDTDWVKVDAETQVYLCSGYTSILNGFVADDGTGLKVFYSIENVRIPDTLPGLLTWLDPTVGLETSNATVVTSWTDPRSGSVLTPVTVAPPFVLAPSAFFGGKPALTFAPASFHLLRQHTGAINTAMTGTSPWTAYAVLRRTATGVGTFTAFGVSSASTFTGVQWGPTANLLTAVRNNTAGSGGTAPGTNPFVLVVTFTGTITTIYADTLFADTLSDNTSVTGPVTFALGARVTPSDVLTNYGNISLGDFLFFTTAHTDDQRILCTRYLSTKYGISPF